MALEHADIFDKSEWTARLLLFSNAGHLVYSCELGYYAKSGLEQEHSYAYTKGSQRRVHVHGRLMSVDKIEHLIPVIHDLTKGVTSGCLLAEGTILKLDSVDVKFRVAGYGDNVTYFCSMDAGVAGHGPKEVDSSLLDAVLERA